MIESVREEALAGGTGEEDKAAERGDERRLSEGGNQKKRREGNPQGRGLDLGSGRRAAGCTVIGCKKDESE